MALGTNPLNFHAGAITISDGTGTPLSITVALGNGDFSIENLAAVLNEVNAYETRGKFSGLAHTNRVYPTFTFSAKVAEFSEDTTGTLADAILKNGTVWSAAVSTLGTGAKLPYTVDIAFALEGTDYSNADTTATMADCYCTIAFAEGDPNTFSISGTVYGAITGDLACAEVA